jgi:hypothetical protein
MRNTRCAIAANASCDPAAEWRIVADGRQVLFVIDA